MKKYFLILFIFTPFKFLYSQGNCKIEEYSFVNINLGMEYKKNNADSLTMGIINVVPLIKLSLGHRLLKRMFYAVSLSYSESDIQRKNNSIIYKKNGLSVNVGFITELAKIKIRNQIGYQLNEYSVINLTKNTQQPTGDFEFKANRFTSKNDIYVFYGLELFSKKNKNLNIMGGITTSYAVSKSTVLTKSYSERISFQLYCGLSFSI